MLLVLPQLDSDCKQTADSYDTVWKFHDFSITRILREINFEDCRSSKSAILTYFEALNLDFYEFLHFLGGYILPKIEIQSLKNCKNGIFLTCTIPKIIFT